MQVKSESFGLPEATIVVLAVTAALGTYLFPIEVGVGLFGFRLLVTLIALFLVVSGRGVILDVEALSRWFFYFGFIWIGWGLLALIWSPLVWGTSIPTGLIELLAVVFGFVAVAIVLNMMLRSTRALNALRFGWTAAFVVTAIVALWEISTGNHLSGYQEELDNPRVGQIVISTFGNPNNYAAFLSLCLPFLIWSARVESRWRRFAYVLLCVALLVLIVVSGGRLAQLAVGLELILLLVFVSFRGKRLVLLTGTALVVFSLLLSPDYLEENSSLKLLRIYDEFVTGGSATIRLNLFRDGVDFVRRSWGMGVGPANFQHMLTTGQGPYPTEGFVNPHNFWLEIASQYGVIVLFFFVGWLLFGLYRFWRIRRQAQAQGEQGELLAAESAILGIVAYLFAAAENSSYIAQQTNWMFLASLLAIGAVIARNNKRRSLPTDSSMIGL